MNQLKTGLLLCVMTALLVFLGELLGGPRGAMTAFAVALAINFIQYWFSDKIVLAMYQAKPLSEAEAPQVYRAVREIASRVHIPMPKLYWVATQNPNALRRDAVPSTPRWR